MRVSIASARVNAGLTQKEVCEKMGITEKTLIMWEKGRIPRADKLIKLCEIYGCDVSDIRLEGEEA